MTVNKAYAIIAPLSDWKELFLIIRYTQVASRPLLFDLNEWFTPAH